MLLFYPIGAVKKLFEPVNFHNNLIFWDYCIRIEHHFKGYYHWHQCCEFMLVHEGQGAVVLNQNTFEIQRGMFFFFQPYQLHQVYAEVSPEVPYVRSIFYADPLLIERQLRAFPARYSRFRTLLQSPNRVGAFDLGAGIRDMERVFEQYEQAAKGGKGEDAEEITLLFLQMINLLPEPEAGSSGEAYGGVDRRTPRYSEIAMRWIEEHYHEEISLERLAEETHLSPNYLSRVFRQETGSSITDYMTARRIKQACRLLETTDRSVEQVGSDVGFANISYFIQLFKRVVGTTPLKYRRDRFPKQ
ncbi:helix-turn-helix domain-containing protein [Paenibacillus tarimensis]